ncbi:hypothetical protein RchiOBHm_Chr4g0390691 [Rosa chinensis]|uniref:Uncharacterized protein n=1 Tax=Rosa chinensis TaxID=74649 RepID=A0A2P6QQA2_ROSCH|nr:hypothetical protein RchiOBHm_Chr4g0390691 [Rosa chinensis]
MTGNKVVRTLTCYWCWVQTVGMDHSGSIVGRELWKYICWGFSVFCFDVS